MGAAARKYRAPTLGAALADPRLKLVKPVEDPAIEQRLSRATVTASIVLREARGERFRKPRSKDQPHFVLDELDIMLERGEISRKLFDAGRRYGDSYRACVHEGKYLCALGNSQRANGLARLGTINGYAEIARIRLEKTLNFKRVRQRAFRGCDPKLMRLCDDICGNDFLIDGGKKERAYATEVMSWLLTRLAYAYGLIW